MGKHDIGFFREDGWFRYKACAIIVEENCVLFGSSNASLGLYPVGGGVRLGETAEEAVIRETHEETGLPYEIDRLAAVVESFYVGDSGRVEGVSCHEVALYFLMKPLGKRETIESRTEKSGFREEMVWVPIEDLDKVRAYPHFIKNLLENPSDGVLHIVEDDR